LKQALHDLWQRLCAVLVPDGLESQGADARRRAELALALIVLATPVVMLRIVALLASGVPGEAAVAGGSLLALLGLVLAFRRTGSLSLIGNGVALLFFAGMSFVAYTRGGVGSPAAIALGLTPLFATFIAGWRSGLGWALAVLGAAAVFAFGLPDLPDLYPAENQGMLDFVGVGVFVALVMITSAAFELAKNAALAAQRDAERDRQRAWDEARMLRADRMASLGQMAASVAHEINTPLTYVMANLTFVESRVSQLEERELGRARVSLLEALAEARGGAVRVAEIVRDLKSFVRTDEEELALLDLRAVMDMAVRMADSEVRPRARLVREYAEIPMVRGNDVRLTQVFVNLLLNAAQAIPEDGAEHAITVTIAPAGVDGVLAEVRDTGAGIPAEILPRVTEPFFTTKAAGVGTGLGLAVCKTIIENHRGTLRIESEVGQGTRVRVLLGAADAAGAGTGTAQQLQAQAAGGPQMPRKRTVTMEVERTLRVLVVDDDDALVRALRRALRAHRLECVSSGQEALERLRADAGFDVVLCDLMMPGMTGMELYEQLEALELGVRERVVFLTGGAFTPRARAFLERVPNRALEKPVSPERLEAILAEVAGPGEVEPDHDCAAQ
jgi:signal transduction histidine kinase/ActR/RegA family two-component response regulator